MRVFHVFFCERMSPANRLRPDSLSTCAGAKFTLVIQLSGLGCNQKWSGYSPDHFGEVDVVGNLCCIVNTETTTSSRRRETEPQRTLCKHNVEQPRSKTKRHGDIIRRHTRWRHLYHRRANKDRRYKGIDQALVRKVLLVGR